MDNTDQNASAHGAADAPYDAGDRRAKERALFEGDA